MCGDKAWEQVYKNSFKGGADNRVDGGTTKTYGQAFKVMTSEKYQPPKPSPYEVKSD